MEDFKHNFIYFFRKLLTSNCVTYPFIIFRTTRSHREQEDLCCKEWCRSDPYELRLWTNLRGYVAFFVQHLRRWSRACLKAGRTSSQPQYG